METVTISQTVYDALLAIENFVRDSCVTGHIDSGCRIAPMSDSERTLGEVFDIINKADNAGVVCTESGKGMNPSGWTTCSGRNNMLPGQPCGICGHYSHERVYIPARLPT